jgi:hypothetical protein
MISLALSLDAVIVQVKYHMTYYKLFLILSVPLNSCRYKKRYTSLPALKQEYFCSCVTNSRTVELWNR